MRPPRPIHIRELPTAAERKAAAAQWEEDHPDTSAGAPRPRSVRMLPTSAERRAAMTERSREKPKAAKGK